MALFDDVVNEVIALCGNRRDNRALFESAVNQAILALWNKHVGHTLGVKPIYLASTDPRITLTVLATRTDAYTATIDLSQDFESVESVSISYDGDGYKKLDRARLVDVTASELVVTKEPSSWAFSEGVVYVWPAFTAAPAKWCIVGVSKPVYYTTGQQITMLPDSMRAAYVALATSIAKTYLGESEAAQSLGILSTILGPREVGPSGKVGAASDMGLVPYGGE